ncbi:MAG: YraN family protein [Pseudorhodoplanes sp.]|nr:YraN family protein [Pseudorhodoplanes sp.]
MANRSGGRRPPADAAADVARRAAFRLGLSAESRAAAVLMAKGFRVVARRWRCAAGEIDLVARRGDLLIFVEVKARGSFDDAAYSVTDRQKRRIASAAAAWIAANPDNANCDIRFDAGLGVPRRWPRHIVAAFECEN